jgi:hypothetical protein
MAWCTLCHADVRSDEEKEAARLEAEQISGAGIMLPAELVLSPAESLVAAAPPRGKHARPSTLSSLAALPAPAALPADAVLARAAGAGSVDVAELDAPAGPSTSAETEQKLAELRQAGIDVDGMLAMLSSSASADPLHGLVDRLSSKGSRAIAVIVASTALTAVIFGLMFLLGSLFG